MQLIGKRSRDSVDNIVLHHIFVRFFDLGVRFWIFWAIESPSHLSHCEKTIWLWVFPRNRLPSVLFVGLFVRWASHSSGSLILKRIAVIHFHLWISLTQAHIAFYLKVVEQPLHFQLVWRWSSLQFSSLIWFTSFHTVSLAFERNWVFKIQFLCFFVLLARKSLFRPFNCAIILRTSSWLDGVYALWISNRRHIYIYTVNIFPLDSSRVCSQQTRKARTRFRHVHF